MWTFCLTDSHRQSSPLVTHKSNVTYVSSAQSSPTSEQITLKSTISLWAERWFLSSNAKDIGTLYLIFALFLGSAFSGSIVSELSGFGDQYTSVLQFFIVIIGLMSCYGCLFLCLSGLLFLINGWKNLYKKILTSIIVCSVLFFLSYIVATYSSSDSTIVYILWRCILIFIIVNRLIYLPWKGYNMSQFFVSILSIILLGGLLSPFIAGLLSPFIVGLLSIFIDSGMPEIIDKYILEIKGQPSDSSSLGNKGYQSKYQPIQPNPTPGGGGGGKEVLLSAKCYKPSDSDTGRSNSVSETVNSESDILKRNFKECLNTVDLADSKKEELISYFNGLYLAYVDNIGKLKKSGTDNSFDGKLNEDVDLKHNKKEEGITVIVEGIIDDRLNASDLNKILGHYKSILADTYAAKQARLVEYNRDKELLTIVLDTTQKPVASGSGVNKPLPSIPAEANSSGAKVVKGTPEWYNKNGFL